MNRLDEIERRLGEIESVLGLDRGFPHPGDVAAFQAFRDAAAAAPPFKVELQVYNADGLADGPAVVSNA